jgi:hypothetical protein
MEERETSNDTHAHALTHANTRSHSRARAHTHTHKRKHTHTCTQVCVGLAVLSKETGVFTFPLFFSLFFLLFPRAGRCRTSGTEQGIFMCFVIFFTFFYLKCLRKAFWAKETGIFFFSFLIVYLCVNVCTRAHTCTLSHKHTHTVTCNNNNENENENNYDNDSKKKT